MLKRGQISIFLTLATVLIIGMGLLYFVASSKQSVFKKENAGQVPDFANSVKTYIESCLSKAGEDALFNRIGLQGGYIDPNGNSITYFSKNVPYYLDASGDYTLPLDEINKKTANYVKVEFEKCFDSKVFEDIGTKITLPSSKPAVTVSSNDEDVNIVLKYHLIVNSGNTKSDLDSFTVTLPIRLKKLHESSNEVIKNIKNSQPAEYDMSSQCYIYDKNGLTNVYLKDIENKDIGNNGKIIQFIDLSTYNKKYLKSFIFQFAVKNVNVRGNCVG